MTTNASLSRLLLLVLLLSNLPVGASEQGDRPYSVDPPGVVVDHMAAKTRQYVGSPSIAILPNGRYVASHDIFGPGSAYSRTRVFESRDQGKSWQRIAEVKKAFWSTLFVHRGDLYMIGASERYGNTVIRRSEDGGRTWTQPTDPKTGLLLADGGYHCAPQPVLKYDGRIWRAMEDNRAGGGWGEHFRSFMMSAPLDADLLNKDNWTISNPVAGNQDWLDGQFNGWLEGNAVAAPDGQVVNILRVDMPTGPGKGAIIKISRDGKTASFDPRTGFIDMPGGSTKFTIRFDAESKYYWALANYIPQRHRDEGRKPGAIRNTLALVRSKDLRDWELRSVVLYHPDMKKHGFQYPDWQFDGDDIVAVSRTAHDDGLGGAHNYHDANFMTFHRIEGFRTARNTELVPTSQARSDASAGKSETANEQPSRRNVLFIAVDDLRVQLGCEDLRESTEGFVGQAIDTRHPAIADIALSQMPPILGYNIVRPRDGCDVVAVWQETDDPMLATGQFDNGRVLAYTSDPAPHWGCNFVYWDQYNRFWIQALDWLLGRV